MNNILIWFTSLEVNKSLWILLSLHVALTFAAIVWVFKLLTPPDEVAESMIWLCALVVMIAMPIGLPLVNRSVYNFYMNNRPFFLLRNATHTALLPYAIACFGMLIELCKRPANAPISWKMALAAGALLFVSALIKPSFAVSIIPSVGLYLLISKRPLSNKLTLMAVMVPAGLLILGQFYIGFVYNPLPPYASNLTIEPWVVWVKNNNYPLLSLLLAIFFPIWVLWHRRNTLALETRIAWINLVLAVIPFILLRQTGGAFTDRDFEWSYLNARQILFLSSIVEWWRWKKQTRELSQGDFPKKITALNVAGAALFTHAVFGYARLLLVDQHAF